MNFALGNNLYNVSAAPAVGPSTVEPYPSSILLTLLPELSPLAIAAHSSKRRRSPGAVRGCQHGPNPSISSAVARESVYKISTSYWRDGGGTNTYTCPSQADTDDFESGR